MAHRKRGVAVALTAIFLIPAFSQTKGGGGTTGTTTGTTGTTTPTNTPSSIPSTNNGTTSTSTQNAPPVTIHVSGRVVMDDGSALTSPAEIERVCNSTRHVEGYTDSSGYFYVTLGQAAGVIQEADDDTGGGGLRSMSQGTALGGVPGTMNTAGGARLGTPGIDNRYSNCELRAKLGGYTSQSVNLTDRTPMDDPNIGTIVIHKMGQSETGTTVTATSLKAPKDARKAMEKGLELEKKNKPEQAIASFQQAVKAYPEFAFAWNELGKLQEESGQKDDARQAFEAASKAEPRWPEPYLRLAIMETENHDWKSVADYSDRVLRLNSFEYPEAFFLNAAANFNLRHVEVAEKAALSAERLDTQHRFPQIKYLLGIILSDQHQYAEAAERLRSYLTLNPNASDAADARKRLDEAEKLAAAATPAPAPATKNQR